MKKSLLLTTLLLSTSLSYASAEYTVITHEITPSSTLKGITPDPAPTTTPTPAPAPTTTPTTTTTSSPTDPSTVDQRIDRAGKVISATKDMVALGEAIYSLVQHGKPTTTTTYAPISVVPKDPATKEAVDMFEMEGFGFPVEKQFQTIIKKGLKPVVTFKYKVVYSYGGSYQGRGKYLTSVLIVPSYVKASFGYDFSAVMSLGGMMNNGTKDQPVAGVMLVLKFKVNSWGSALERNDTIYVNGRGELKSYITAQ